MKWITADFPQLQPEIAARIRAYTTTKQGGVSVGEFSGFNLATHVGDVLDNVRVNRSILREQLQLPSEPYWLNQQHSNQVLEIPYQYRSSVSADSSYTLLKQHVCLVMTADCLPILVVDTNATEVAAIHAGWKGLANGVIANNLACFNAPISDLHVWLGPAIGSQSFEVGEEIKKLFVDLDSDYINCFKPKPSSQTSDNSTQSNKFLCDIYHIARIQLKKLGVVNISGGQHCTYAESELFYSYRREGKTGRMASFIWFE